jgi:PAS domain S-box-containing protein
MQQHIKLKAIIDAIPSAIFIVNQELKIIDINQAASKMVGVDSEIVLRKLCGEILHCLHEKESKARCGATEFCSDCVIRDSVEKATQGKSSFKQKYKLKVQQGENIEMSYMLISAAPFEYDNQIYAVLTIEDITELTELREMLPICSKCKKIRNDKQYWEDVDVYFRKKADIKFSHGICPDCSDKLYSQMKSRI